MHYSAPAEFVSNISILKLLLNNLCEIYIPNIYFESLLYCIHPAVVVYLLLEFFLIIKNNNNQQTGSIYIIIDTIYIYIYKTTIAWNRLNRRLPIETRLKL